MKVFKVSCFRQRKVIVSKKLTAFLKKKMQKQRKTLSERRTTTFHQSVH